MRLGVLDIGSNTGHLLVVDAHGGALTLTSEGEDLGTTARLSSRWRLSLRR